MHFSQTILLTVGLASMAFASPTPGSLLTDGMAASIDKSLSLVEMIGWFDLGEWEAAHYHHHHHNNATHSTHTHTGTASHTHTTHSHTSKTKTTHSHTTKTTHSHSHTATATGAKHKNGTHVDKDVKYCVASSGQRGNCVALGHDAKILSNDIASLVHTSSAAKDCTPHTGSLDNVVYSVYATGGTSCSTTAHQETVEGALRKYLKQQGDKVCNTHCIKMSHAADKWTGYVTLAAVGGSNTAAFYCGEKYNFEGCSAGGKKGV